MPSVGPIAVVVRRAAVVVMCLAVLTAPSTSADPEVDPAAATAPAPDGRVPSNPPTTLNTPDGWTLGLGAKDESQFRWRR